MIKQSTLDFLTKLSLNNSRDWLAQNKKTYETSKDDILTLTEELIDSFSYIDRTFSKSFLDPKKCMTRINRDLRFTKFKIPYKTDYYIILNKNGKSSSSAFYFLHIEPENCFVGGGVHNPESPELRKIRHAINYDFDKFLTIVQDKTFQKTFPSGIHSYGVLKKIPREFEKENPASEFLKMKGFYTMEKITDHEITLKETFEKINLCFKTTKPLVDYLNQVIENELKIKDHSLTATDFE